MTMVAAAQGGCLLPLLAVDSARGLWLVYVVVVVESVLGTVIEPCRNVVAAASVPSEDLMTVTGALANALESGPAGRWTARRPDPRARWTVHHRRRRRGDLRSDSAARRGPVPVAVPRGVGPSGRADAGRAAAGLAGGFGGRRQHPAGRPPPHGDLPAGLRTALPHHPERTGAHPALGLYVGLFIAVGLPGLASLTGLMTILQSGTPAAARGRVLSTFFAIYGGLQAVGMLVAGLVGSGRGLQVQGALYLVAAVLALRLPAPQRDPAPATLG